MHYTWLMDAAGRKKGQTENLDHEHHTTQTWVKRGWIEAKAPPALSKPEPKDEPVKAVAFDGPPEHRAMTRGKVQVR